MAVGHKRIWSTREFYIVEIGTLESYGSKRVWQFMEGRYNEVLLYPQHIYWFRNNRINFQLCSPILRYITAISLPFFVDLSVFKTYCLFGVLELGDNCIQNFHLGRYIIGFTEMCKRSCKT